MRLVLIDLRPLVTMPRVLDGKRMKIELVRDEIDFLAIGIRDVQPAWMRSSKLGKLIRWSFDDSMWLFGE